jgi:signal transduction histidine kinase
MTKADLLIVDDSTSNLLLLSDILGENGYEVRTVQSGHDALDVVFSKRKPDLIMMDVLLPDISGYEVCEQIKADEATQHIPVVFISALDDTADIQRAFEAGGVDYVTKPVNRREVVARIENQLTLLSQRRALEEHYRRELERHEYVNQMRERFVHSATHDLKNPLHLISGYASLLLEVDGREYDEVGHKYVNLILEGANKMKMLVADMLDLAQMSTGSYINPTKVALNGFIEGCISNFSIMARQKSITLDFIRSPDAPAVFIDTIRMERVMDNLISNAIKYTADGGQVEVSTAAAQGFVVIAVRDTGSGIPAKDIPHIFEAFYRVRKREHREIDGTGLGLTIAKAIVEMHNGELEVESEEGVGSEFRIILPGWIQKQPKQKR